jgi:uncharacterized protein (UPF0303 family)
MDIAALEQEQAGLGLPRFAEPEALRLGAWLVAEAEAGALPVVIDIRTPTRTLFHASLPGSAPNNDNWARRKSNVAFTFATSSLLQRLKHEAKGQSLARSGLSEADHALSGGAVPVVVAGTGVVAVATVSGLPDTEDHALVVRGIRALMG